MAEVDNRENRSFGQLFAELSQKTAMLIRQELDLVRTEMTAKAATFGKDAGFLVAGGLVIYAGLLTVIAAIVLVLITVHVPAWLSALIVGVVVALIGYALVRKGINDMRKTSVAPRQTLDSLKENQDWVREQTRQ